MTPRTSVIWDDGFTAYNFGPEHPMGPIRLDLTTRLLRAFGVFEGGGVTLHSPNPASEETLATAHDPGYIAAVKHASVDPKTADVRRGLGTEDDPTLDAHRTLRLRVGDSLLACSDGLWHYFTTQELGMVLQTLPPRDASQFLVEKARSRAMGHGDNLSLAIVKIEPLVEHKTAPTEGAVAAR